MVKFVAYKGFDRDFKCRGFQYEVGKIYEHVGDISLSQKGFHACRCLTNCFIYYDESTSRFAEVEILGEYQEDDEKLVTNKIHVVRELSRDEIISIYMCDLGLHPIKEGPVYNDTILNKCTMCRSVNKRSVIFMCSHCPINLITCESCYTKYMFCSNKYCQLCDDCHPMMFGTKDFLHMVLINPDEN